MTCGAWVFELDTFARMPPRLAIYRHSHFRISEGYISEQAKLLTGFQVRLFGVDLAADPPPVLDVWTMAGSLRGRLETPILQATRRSPFLASALKSFRPDVLMTHFAQDGWRVSALAARLRVPHVVFCHGSDVLVRDEHAAGLGFSGRQLRGNWRALSDQTTAFLASSEFIGKALVDRGIPADKVHVSYIGVDVPGLLDRPPGTRNQILFIGRLVESKGVDDLLKAAAPLFVAGVLDRVVLAGDGPERPRLEQLARSELGLGERQVLFLGQVQKADLGGWIESSTLLCLPSRRVRSGASEGFGLVSLEAQVRGVPVVVTRVGGLPETVQDGSTGFVVEPGSEGLGRALHTLLTNADMAHSMGVRGREWVAREFDIRDRTSKLQELLLTLSRQ